jgi:DNA (cytosine-5)-methyltransferase 1
VTYTFTDVFCGAGGSSIGLTEAGFELKLAANHWSRAIETHSANFPHAEHLCADVNNYDMRRLPTTDVGWFSPICTEVSPAGGRRRRRRAGQGELELWGPVAKAGLERTRATFHDVIRATEVHRYKAVLVENVVDVAEVWELFDWWVEGMQRLGYQVQYVSVSSAHVGGDETDRAPQWRDRLYLVFTRTGIPLPDVDPRPLAWCPDCGTDVQAVQSWKKPGRRIGKYRQQYLYRCPNSACRHAVVEPYVVPAAAAIDWTDLGTRIGDKPAKKRYGGLPLAPATMARIEAGLAMFTGHPEPFVTVHRGSSGEARVREATVPLPTVTASGNHLGLSCPPVMVSVNHDDGHRRTYRPDQAPLPARTVKIGDGLVCSPFVTELRGGGSVARLVADPLATVTASGNHHGLTVPPGAFVVKNYTPRGNPGQVCKDPQVEPLGAVTARDHHSMVIPLRRGARPHRPRQAPLSTVTTRESHGLLGVGAGRIEVMDCSFRMLTPREHLRAQRFPDSYVVTGNKGEQTMQAGNAVSANVARWLAGRVAAALDGR